MVRLLILIVMAGISSNVKSQVVQKFTLQDLAGVYIYIFDENNKNPSRLSREEQMTGSNPYRRMVLEVKTNGKCLLKESDLLHGKEKITKGRAEVLGTKVFLELYHDKLTERFEFEVDSQLNWLQGSEIYYRRKKEIITDE